MDRETFARIVAGDWTEDLTRAEAEAFETLLNDAECQDLVAKAEHDLDDLAAQWEPPEPNWDRVTLAIKSELNQPQNVITPNFGGSSVESTWNSPAVFAMAAAVLFLAGITFVLGSLGPGGNPASQEGMAVTIDKRPAVAASKVLVLPKPAAEVLTLEASQGFQASQSVLDDDLLVVVLEQDS